MNSEFWTKPPTAPGRSLTPPMTPPMTLAVKFDEGKVPLELVPASMMWATAKVLAFGAKKYGARNWEKGMEWSRVYGALLRHVTCWFAGCGPTKRSFLFGEIDDETQLSHLWHAACCIAFLIEWEETAVGTDDRPKGGGQ